jgi:hypothetical protein
MSDRVKNIVKETVKKLREESSTGGGGASMSPGTGPQYATKYAYKLTGYEPVDESNIGASLGPGPKAGPEGVKDNYYVKAWKYKLVPKKIKKSGLEVKHLFENEPTEADKFQQERINAFGKIEKELNSLSPMLSNAKNQTIEFYQNNPGSSEIIISTDLISEYIEDIKKLLKGEENENP